MVHHIGCDTFQNINIGLRQIQAGHTGLPCDAAGNDHNIRAFRCIVIAGADDGRRMERSALIDIQCLTKGFVLIDIHQNDLRCNTLHHKVIGNGRADTSRADNTDFTHNNYLSIIFYQLVFIN